MRYLIFIFAFLFSHFLFAQSRRIDSTTFIQWMEKDYSFGKVLEGEDVLCKYEFVNNGTKDLIIHNIKGDISFNYSQNAIKVGEKGYIEVYFNTKGTLGRKHKTLYVYTNWGVIPLSLWGWIMPNGGEGVESCEANNLKEYGFYNLKEVPKTTIKWDENVWNFGTLEEGVLVAHTFRFTNTGENDLIIPLVRWSEFGLECEHKYQIIKPQESGEIKVFFGGDDIERGKFYTGFQKRIIHLMGNVEGESMYLTIKGEVKSMPKTVVSWKKEAIYLGKIELGESKIISFPLQNVGKNDMLIRKVEKPTWNISANIPSNGLYVHPSESTSLEIEFVPKQKGIFTHTIIVKGNFSEKLLTIKAEVI